MTLEWWDLPNPSDDSIWYEEERQTGEYDLCYKDDEEEEEEYDLWVREEVDYRTRSGHPFKPQEQEGDHLGQEFDKGKGKTFDDDEEEDRVPNN